MTTDVRMKGFAKRVSVEQVLDWIDSEVTSNLANTRRVERVKIDHAAGRVLADEIKSQVNVPGFRRAMMDGFAIRAAEVLGADVYNPITLETIGEVLPGQECRFNPNKHEAVRVMTGAEVPHQCDTVVPVEQVETSGDKINVLASIAERKNVAVIGEDISMGETVFVKGRRLRPQDVGLIASIGIDEIDVYRKPVVRILTTGNELLPPGSKPQGVQIVDSNSPMLAALIERDGGLVRHPGIVPDDQDSIKNGMLDEVDVVLVSGGSSTGQEDFAPRILAQNGELKFHGIAMRPSSPAGVGRLENRFVFLLPGNPVSCLCAYDFFAGRCIRQLGGGNRAWPYRRQSLQLSKKIVSTIGRTDYARIQIIDDMVEPIAISGASILSSTSKADGFCVIPQDSEGYSPGSFVDVFLYDF